MPVLSKNYAVTHQIPLHENKTQIAYLTKYNCTLTKETSFILINQANYLLISYVSCETET